MNALAGPLTPEPTPPASPAGRVIRFALRRPTLSLNVLKGMNIHAERAYKKAMAKEIMVALIGQRPTEPFARAHVHIVRYSLGDLDYDNLVGGMKPLIDCLLPLGSLRIIKQKRVFLHPHGLGVILDDARHTMELHAEAVRVRRATEQRTEVTITELPTLDTA